MKRIKGGIISKSWYLHQNPDVKASGIKPLSHYLKYGRYELRTWFQPNWFRSAFKKNGWIWNENLTTLNYVVKNPEIQIKNYQGIKIHRIGIYSQKISNLRTKIQNK